MEPENSLPWPQFFITQVIGSDDLPDVQILTLPGYESKDAVSDLEHLLEFLRSGEIEESQLIVGSGVDQGPHACLGALRQAILDGHHRGNMLSSDPKRIETYAETIYTSNQLPIMNSPLTGSSLLQLVMAGGTSAGFMAAFPHDLGHITAYFLLVGGTRIVLGAADGVSIGLKQGLSRVILRWMGIPESRATTKKRMGRSGHPVN